MYIYIYIVCFFFYAQSETLEARVPKLLSSRDLAVPDLWNTLPSASHTHCCCPHSVQSPVIGSPLTFAYGTCLIAYARALATRNGGKQSSTVPCIARKWSNYLHWRWIHPLAMYDTLASRTPSEVKVGSASTPSEVKAGSARKDRHRSRPRLGTSR